MVDAKMVRDIATKYIYDRCPAVVGVGKKILLFYKFSQILWETDMKVSLSKSNFIIPQALHSGALSLNSPREKNPIFDSFFCFVFFFCFIISQFFLFESAYQDLSFFRFSSFVLFFF